MNFFFKIRRSRAFEISLWFIAMLGLHALQPFSAQADDVISCDIQHGPCTGEANGMTVTFDILPKPVKPLSELQYRVTIKRKNIPVTNAPVALDLTMPGMYMGKNRPLLKHIGQGTYQGTGIITRCISGQRIWQATVTVDRHDVLYQFEVQ